MALSPTREKLVSALQDGLPLSPRPYRALGESIGLDERDVIDGIDEMLRDGVIKRFGVIVRHRELGIAANAMVVFDVADDDVDRVGEWLGAQDCVTLCYRRPRRRPRWPYNLFCMIHGRERAEVLAQLERITTAEDLARTPREVLFSLRRFRQCGARIVSGGAGAR